MLKSEKKFNNYKEEDSNRIYKTFLEIIHIKGKDFKVGLMTGDDVIKRKNFT